MPGATPKTTKPRGVDLEASSLLPKRSISRTWKYEADGPKQARPTPPRPVAPEARARARAAEYARTMAAEGLTRAELARRLGVSRAWVTKALRSLSKSVEVTNINPRIGRTQKTMVSEASSNPSSSSVGTEGVS